MQEDTFYAKHLDKKTNIIKESPRLTKQEIKLLEIEELQQKTFMFVEEVVKRIGTKNDNIEPYSLSWTTIKVAVNDMLSNYKKVRAVLKKKKIPVVAIYGSSNPEPYIPEKYVVSIRETISMSHIQEILLSLKETGVEGFNIFDELSDEEDVYIGSYDYEVYSVLDDEFWQLLSDESIDEVDFETMRAVKTIK